MVTKQFTGFSETPIASILILINSGTQQSKADLQSVSTVAILVLASAARSIIDTTLLQGSPGKLFSFF